MSNVQSTEKGVKFVGEAFRWLVSTGQGDSYYGNENANVTMGGTLLQPAYDCSKHVRKYDAMLLTNNWNDIVAGGYLQSGDTTPPAPQTGIGVQ